MQKIKKWVLYPGYILGITILFLYLRFPSEAAKGYLSGYLERHYPEYRVSIGNVSPAFPPGLRLETVSLAYRGEMRADLDWMDIKPRYVSLLRSRKALQFKGRAYRGNIAGSVEIAEGQAGYRMALAADLTGVMLEDNGYLQTLAGRRVAGTLGGRIRYASDKVGDGLLNVELDIENGEVGLANPVFSIDNLEFGRLEAEVIVDKRSLKLKRCDVTGEQVDAEVTGVLLFRKPFERSRLEFKGTVMPHHLLMASLQKVLPKSLLPSRKVGDKGYPIKVYGTIEKPKFVLR